MLLGLSIRNVVLIDALDLSFAGGLLALTGETGAGKSILLDSLGLAMGARGDSGLVRSGAPQLSVTASFSLPDGHPAFALLAEGEIDSNDPLLLRRVISADGRSRAWINDQPVSVSMLRRVGALLVEVHGQFESHGLLDSDTHAAVLDAFGGIDTTVIRRCWSDWQTARRARREAEDGLAQARREEDFLRHMASELDALAPRPGEEEELAERRSLLMQGEKLAEGLQAASAALTQKGDVEASLRAAERALQRIADRVHGQLDDVLAALARAAAETADARAQLDRLGASVDLDPQALEKVEERLFALRAMARKHQIAVEDLPALRRKVTEQLAALDAGGDSLTRLSAAEKTTRAAYCAAAASLSTQRKAAAAALDQAIAAELPPLKLDKARMVTDVSLNSESTWSASGQDRVEFTIATNPGTPPGPLGKVASGGELSRLMLALKVVLARTSPIPTLVFDEVDSGIGGAVAAAVGDRLARLARHLQILVVTHSPQVAARAARHWHVAKGDDGKGGTLTRIAELDHPARQEEIARMLSGATVTSEARAAASRLLQEDAAKG